MNSGRDAGGLGIVWPVAAREVSAGTPVDGAQVGRQRYSPRPGCGAGHMTPPKVLIIGGGIGGLTTALALHKVGVAARVVEQAPALRPVGAGITLQANATAVLQALGVSLPEDDVLPIQYGRIVSSTGRTLGSANLADLDVPAPAVTIHRAELQRALNGALSEAGGQLELGRRLAALRPTESHVDAILEDGEVVSADLLIGADGLNSTVRRMLFGSTGTRYSGQTCWRFACPLPFDGPDATIEGWHGTRRFGLVPLSRGRLYVFLVETSPPGTASDDTVTAAFLKQRFHGLDPLLDRVLDHLVDQQQQGEPVGIHHDDLRDQPHVSFGKGRTVLIGDAGHATTPNLGQGAGMAIEDAAAVAIAVASGAVEPARVSDHLDGTRRDRVVKIQSTSWRLGSVAHWSNPIAVAVRNTLLGWIPDSTARSQAMATVAPGLELAATLREIVAAG